MRTAWYAVLGFGFSFTLVAIAYVLAAYGPTAGNPETPGGLVPPTPDPPGNDSGEGDAPPDEPEPEPEPEAPEESLGPAPWMRP